MSDSEKTGLEVALIGMAGHFPDSKNINEFWENLTEGVELISVFSEVEQKYNDSSQPNKVIKAGAVLEGVELFDAGFFGFNPREAEVMDPQHRLLLECAWEALENAGYDSEREDEPIGFYAGVNQSTYFLHNIYPNRQLMESIGSLQSLMGSDKDFAPTRVSYKLNLKGPSLSVQTACSSSLVAVHLACQSLLSGECKMALAAGVTVKVPQNELTLSSYEVISPDGHCRAFDAEANGTIGGNGIGVVVLKRLEDAIADRDYIYAVIKGSAINNDGGSKVGYTAPSEEGQAKVIQAAQIMAEVEPKTITYMEAQGFGTPLGDPIEIAGMTQAFRVSTDKKGYCAIGSVKTNIGHLAAAAGITGLIKTVLALHHKLLPPTLHFKTPNPRIDFGNSPFYVNTKLSEWKANGFPRRAGVSSFGFGGTNAHVILEEAPLVEASSPSRSKQLLVLSAKTHSALERATDCLANHLKYYPDLNLADVAYTLQVGRRAFDHRRMVVVEDLKDALKTLESVEPQKVFTSLTQSSDRPVVFMFTGQGAQYVNMAREIYQSEAIFRQECDHCCELLKPQLGLDLRPILYPTDQEAQKAAQQLQQIAISQPALFVIEYALAQLWISWGVNPVAMIGHSIGEYVAACLAGVFSLKDALALAAARGKLMQQLPSGSMLAIPMSEMEPIMEPFKEQLKQVSLKPPQIPYVSNLTSTWITPEEATAPSYWTSHLRQTVRFAECLRELLKQPTQILLEVGPGRTLTKLAKQHPEKKPDQVVLTSVRHPQEKQSDLEFLLNTLGQLWLAGVQIDWSGFYAHEQRDRLPLPTYPFERQRYWIEPPKQVTEEYQPLPTPAAFTVSLEQKNAKQTPKVSSGEKLNITDWFYIPSWKRSMPPPFQSGVQATQPGCWLVFVDEWGLGAQILKRLELEGHDLITVRVGEQFSNHSKSPKSQREYTINPRQRDDYDALVKELLTLGLRPQKIVHLWSLTAQSHIRSELEEADQTQEQGFYSLLFLAQALEQQNVTNELQIAVISNNLQSVTGEDMLSPEKATLLGPVKVIPLEYPNICCRSIDVMLPETGSWQEKKLIDCLLAELNLNTFDEVIAYRGVHRWTPAFEKVRLDEALKKTPRLRQGGIYLITGGLGAIGLALSSHLAKTVKARLILTDCLAFPGKDKWEEWLSNHDHDDDVSHKICKLQELEELGAKILVARADVADLEAMQQVIAQVQEQFGEINGVIHAASVLGEGMIGLKTHGEVESVFAPKVRGTLVLDTILKDVKLDFIILCSSLASITPIVGQISYCSANNFLDAFANYKTAKDGTFTISINWWSGWQGSRIVDPLNDELLPSEDIDVFRQIMGITLPQVLLSPTNLIAEVNHNNTGHILNPFKKKAKPNLDLLTQSIHPRPKLNNDYVAPRNEIEKMLADIWQEVLGIKQIGIYDNFFELRGDSLLAVQVVYKISEKLQTHLPTSLLFETATVAGLVEKIETIIGTDQKRQTSTSNVLGNREEIEL